MTSGELANRHRGGTREDWPGGARPLTPLTPPGTERDSLVRGPRAPSAGYQLNRVVAGRADPAENMEASISPDPRRTYSVALLRLRHPARQSPTSRRPGARPFGVGGSAAVLVTPTGTTSRPRDRLAVVIAGLLLVVGGCAGARWYPLLWKVAHASTGPESSGRYHASGDELLPRAGRSSRRARRKHYFLVAFFLRAAQ